MVAVAGAMYRNTQTLLERRGVESMVLYRGVENDIKTDSALRPEKTITTVGTRSLSSWSIDAGSAMAFMGGDDYGDGSQRGSFLIQVVPRSRIFATAATGIGCLGEFEIVVMPPKTSKSSRVVALSGRTLNLGDTADMRSGQDMNNLIANAVATAVKDMGLDMKDIVAIREVGI
jgi:hypothetical protein